MSKRLPVGGVGRKSLEALSKEIQEVYCADARPWVVGYSGGKDSTTTLQLIWRAIAALPASQRMKPIYVIASDTLVETPAIVGYIDRTLARIDEAAEAQGLPFSAAKVRPLLRDTFWVKMIGKGYPAPYRRFRWCTDRLKIQPANRFIKERVSEHGEVVLVLGVRRAESAARAKVMSQHKRAGELLSRHSVIHSAWVYTPIEDFSTDDVWTYLLSVPSPWGNKNRELVTLYRNAQAGECPLVVDSTTPSCGNSRFGCWTCTVVDRDKSMESLIDSGEEWLEPLLDLRDWLTETRDPLKKREFREIRRRDGTVRTWGTDEKKDKIVWGPYKLSFRKKILRRVLEAQKTVRRGPDPTITLISTEELHEIRRIWRAEEGDWEDSVPQIYEACTGSQLAWELEDTPASSLLDRKVLEVVCAEHDLPLKLVRELIDLERSLQGLGRRTSVFKSIGDILAKDWRADDAILEAIGWAESEQSPTSSHNSRNGKHDAAEAPDSQ